ncbi:MAG: UvrB/UvrC motif-containing protein [Planctomycetota bacterium]
MLCGKCNKKQATIHMTEIVNHNINQELHLCADCAQKEGVTHKMPFSLAELMGSFMEPIIGKMVKEMADAKCDHCGMSYLLFKTKMRFGCANDYEVFKSGVEPLLEKIHNSTHHTGKVPAQINPNVLKEKELKDLQKELEQLVRIEKFEEAVKIRDKINLLRQKPSPRKNAVKDKKPDENR